jgi:hypothetical protein
MLKLRSVGNSLPESFIVDPSASFQPGQIGELTVIGNQVMMTVSNGTAPFGIIDDIRTKAFTNVSWNETIIVPAAGVPGPGGQLVSASDIMKELKRPNILPTSFSSTVKVVLNPVNGIITFLAGTPLNIDLSGTGTPNGIKTIVNYTYEVPNIPGDDSTVSGRVTVWFQRMMASTTMFETNQQYPVRANLFVSERGLLTTRKPSALHPAVAMVTSPPSPISPQLEFLWF